MKLSQGVEWGLHCATLLAQAPANASVSRHYLAEHFGLPEAYLAKHLQAMVRSGVLSASTGPRGGFRLARAAEETTALDIVEAIEGTAAPFTCQEIRRRGNGAAAPADCLSACAVSAVMASAHQAWQNSLRATTVSRLVELVPDSLRERNRSRLAAIGSS
ncbi:MAG: Rrf2 family transcriptional regulator [Actinomycetota bacterium]|nr:Rrf2 family transcriptional regulator [Actinomycetota bacterium]